MHAKLVGLIAGVLVVGMVGLASAQGAAPPDDACQRDPVYAKSSPYCICSKDKHSDACKCALGDKAACERAYPTPRGKGGAVK